jgi:Fic-DOC domain mobile mystery protein B
MKFEYKKGATPLDPDEIHNLRLKHISTQKDLDELEAANIIQGQLWAFSQKRKTIMTLPFLLKLHKNMFGEVWSWAGKYRRSQTNIGVEPFRIPSETGQLLEEVVFQLHSNTYTMDEIATRFHHKLVWIHPFTNGNGRHARLMTDLLLYTHGHSLFTWGRHNLNEQGSIRQEYINALKAADKNNFDPLMNFVRS